jgi:hypothetical protein
LPNIGTHFSTGTENLRQHFFLIKTNIIMFRFTIAFLFVACFAPVFNFAQKTQELTKVLELQMPEGSGANGSSVIWHAEVQKYYAVFAGNLEFPLAVFDNKGERLSDDDLFAQLDIRGMWYNTKCKKIQGNGYSNSGWINYELDENAIPQTTSVQVEGMRQPAKQSVGTYNAENGKVYFLKGNMILAYKDNGDELGKEVTLFAGKTDEKDTKVDESQDPYLLPSTYNSTTVVYTGKANAELGLYNTENQTIELYDIKTGLMTEKLKLPEDAPKETVFNLAYANDTVWLFNKVKRQWVGYK